ncbi:MAG: 2,3-bisphosphoglycerate-independent phosphoglycerate mutase [Deltaproteobacteria bacterium]|nr:2,3-bisphosphoglycerate-independent phosphoglycerate mutase [Deltaproteobacteria bacterium]
MDRETQTASKGPVVLIVRDGWGRNPNPQHHSFNALELAETPVCDELLRQYPWTLIQTSGEDVGLPEGTMGNSEVGHQNLGAGRIVDQESVRITRSIREGSFFDNEVLKSAVQKATSSGSPGRGAAVHLFGIASDAGVHGLLTHLYACLELCRRNQVEKVWLHLFTDGRDTGPFTGAEFIEEVEKTCGELGVGAIATLCGRYWAMDRDNRWERVQRAYDALTGRGEPVPHFSSAATAMADAYAHPVGPSQQGDEFVTPRTVGPASEGSGLEGSGLEGAAKDSRVQDGDVVIFYNYRGDRPREITKAFVLEDFYGSMAASPDSGERGFDRGPRLDLTYVTMTAYEADLDPHLQVAFPKLGRMENIGGAILSDLGLRQFRCAETEKFPHVTFFFNDYRDEPFPGESRSMAQSPRVATYDLQPEMSARQVCDSALDRLRATDCEEFLLVNFANTDMVGHTGKLPAAIRAAEVVDACVGELVAATLERGGKLIVTADHGNAEQMWDPETKAPHTAHTTYDVELILVDPGHTSSASGNSQTPSASLRAGRLADVFPTVLELLGIEQPAAMTGKSLLGR